MWVLALFGTDGARGIANQDLTIELATSIGWATAKLLERPARVLIGRDTRVSGPMLEAALTAGLTAAGVDVVLVGMLPTPALAHLISAMGADAGVMISASHNPPEYNGIKLLDKLGRKWSTERESEVEHHVSLGVGASSSERIGRVSHLEDTAVLTYTRYLRSLFQDRLPALSVVADLAHGASTRTAPDVLEALGLSFRVLHSEPMGELINQGSGATHPEVVQHFVQDLGADLGLSFDGDADRVMAVDREGRIVDGDEILYVLATGLKAIGKLPGDQVVATVMTNLGIERALADQGISLIRTPVGDRWVAETMRETGAVLGGEQSGHVILKEWAETGDGLLTGLALLAELKRRDADLADVLRGVERFPQVLKNVTLSSKGVEWETIPGLLEAVSNAEQDLGEDGRVLIRPSGTEPLLRIMLEGRDVEKIEIWADRLQAVVRDALESAKA